MKNWLKENWLFCIAIFIFFVLPFILVLLGSRSEVGPEELEFYAP